MRSADAARAIDAIRRAFQFEFHEQLLQIDVRDEQAILAVVGEGMKGRPGVAGKLFDALGRQNINISAIAQGASERNISCVIDAAEQVRALNAIHQGFFETNKRLALAFIGVGNVGGAVLDQLAQQRRYLLRRASTPVVGLAEQPEVSWPMRRHRSDEVEVGARRRPRTHGRRGIRAAGGREIYQCRARGLHGRSGGGRRVSRVHRRELPHRHAEQVGERPAVDPLLEANEQLERRKHHFLFEANVGAGLPIVSTLRDLIASGDEIVKIEGILSGTLSYLFNTFDGRTPFSALVADAHTLGHGARSARGSLGPGRGAKAADSRQTDRPDDGPR